MKKFIEPELEIVTDLNIEDVYAASGSVPPTDPPLVPAGGDWTMKSEWCNHNSGSHSELKIKAHNYGQNSGDCLAMNFVIRGFKIDKIITGDSCLIVSNQTETSFTLSRTDRHFNPGENIEFVMQITAKDSVYHGAVGQTGQPCPAEVVCVSYNAN